MENLNYKEFIKHKEFIDKKIVIDVNENQINDILFDFQKAIVKWALRKGKSAIFADCGLGKTLMQLEWCRLTNGTCLIVAPLCVSKQTIKEAEKLDISINYIRSKEEIERDKIHITNYEMLHCFDNMPLDAVVLDESSIIKNIAGKIRKKLINIFAHVPLKLCCTATPCPNDYEELGNHSEFLDKMKYAEMLATYFVNKANTNSGWILKGHAKTAFYKWLASWSVALSNPADLNFNDNGFSLTNLNIIPEFVKVEYKRDDELFFTGLKGVKDRAAVRKHTHKARCEKAVEFINSNNEQWICWCGLNVEQDYITRLLDDCVSVSGSDSIESKEEKIWEFLDGKTRVLVTKPKIAGFGMNFQGSHNMVFVGLNDSYETYYQCIRREWRYKQKHDVNVHVVLSEIERDIFKNVLRKEEQTTDLIKNICEHTRGFSLEELNTKERPRERQEIKKYNNDEWIMYGGDCIKVLPILEKNSIDFSIYSPPFINLFSYTNLPEDVGNSKDEEIFYKHYGFFIEQLMRVTKEGRNTAVHVSQVPARLMYDGYIGLKDFRGRIVSEYVDRGWVYHGEIVIQKNPQVQAVRTKSKCLLFIQMKRDSSWLRPGLADYILLFKKPGENKIPVRPNDISNNDWIKWAHPVWFDIKETNTLNKAEARTEKDEKHICPLQLDVIDRCIRLWSNEGETVLSPFAGIGSEGYQALLRNRKFIGIELKKEYVDVAIKNLQRALHKKNDLFAYDSQRLNNP